MGYTNEDNAAAIVNAYMENEMNEDRKITERELSGKGIAPEAKAAFSRKPYYVSACIGLKSRPVLR